MKVGTLTAGFRSFYVIWPLAREEIALRDGVPLLEYAEEINKSSRPASPWMSLRVAQNGVDVLYFRHWSTFPC